MLSKAPVIVIHVFLFLPGQNKAETRHSGIIDPYAPGYHVFYLVMLCCMSECIRILAKGAYKSHYCILRPRLASIEDR